MQGNAVGDDLGGEEGDAGDHQQEAVEGRAALEQRSPGKDASTKVNRIRLRTPVGGRH